jgi:hypothetical protein
LPRDSKWYKAPSYSIRHGLLIKRANTNAADFDPLLFSRVEPRCSGCRRRWRLCRFPGRPQSDYHTFLPLVPSSNRTSGFPRYGSPTTFPISLSVTVVVELQQLTELI